MTTTSRAVLIALVEELEATVDDFNSRWPNYVRHLELYQLPVLTEQSVPVRIEPVLLVGDEALTLALHAYGAFGYEPGQHPATTARFPGVLILSQSLEQQIQKINELKDRIRAVMAQHPPGSRAAIARQTLPGKAMLHLYRRIHFASNVRRILWTWAGHTTGNRNVTVEQAADEIEAGRNYPPEHISRDQWGAIIDAEIRLLGTLGPSPRLLFRRRIAPHPRISIYPLADKTPPAVHHGNLPLVVYTPEDEPLPEITPLREYIEGVRTGLRRDRQRLVPVIERIHLYARPPQ